MDINLGLRLGASSPHSAVMQTLNLNTNPDNTFTIEAQGEVLSIDIMTPQTMAGTYTLVSADLSGGPVNLVPARLIGIAEPGATLSVMPGLWGYQTAGGEPLISYQWMKDGVPLSGATSDNLLLTANEADAQISVIETAQDALGTRFVESQQQMVAPLFSIYETDTGRLQIDDLGQADFALDISGATAFDGQYTQDTDGAPLNTTNLLEGAINVARPSISGTPFPGQILTARPGLWICESADNTFQANIQWLRDGTAIAGATASTLTISPTDTGTQISIIEQTTGLSGTRSVESGAITIG